LCQVVPVGSPHQVVNPMCTPTADLQIHCGIAALRQLSRNGGSFAPPARIRNNAAFDREGFTWVGPVQR
jgi:hypothetical protein